VLNIERKLATLATFQPPRSWLNALAELNMLYMVVAAAVFHLEMSPLNAVAS
jgi:hypothetical protein